MSNDDEPETKGNQVRQIGSPFWPGDWVCHVCDKHEEAIAGLVLELVISSSGIEYFVQWSIGESTMCSDIELRPAEQPT